MSDIKLFQLDGNKVTQLINTSLALERSLQSLIEQHLEDFLGVRFLATEYSTGPIHGGRIDSLGIDENSCPVIIEYKRAINENVVTQGLFYLDWLMDHKADFKLLTMERFGKEAANSIVWATPRLLCIAGDFTKYDEHAVKQMSRNIELIRYRHYGNLLLFELVNNTSKELIVSLDADGTTVRKTDKTVTEHIQQADVKIQDLIQSIQDYLLALGDDVQMNTLKLYIAFKRIRNFACVQCLPKGIIVYLKLDPSTVKMENGFTRNMTDIGHWGTGDLEVVIRSDEDFVRAQPLFNQAYELS